MFYGVIGTFPEAWLAAATAGKVTHCAKREPATEESGDDVEADEDAQPSNHSSVLSEFRIGFAAWSILMSILLEENLIRKI
jgi:hypothetical protein